VVRRPLLQEQQKAGSCFPQCCVQHCGKLHRIAVPEHMHVHRERLVAQQVIMQGRHIDAARREFRHDRIDLGFGQVEIAYHHALIAHLLEGQPAAQREAGFKFDAIERGAG
jgi:hypothetical protein